MDNTPNFEFANHGSICILYPQDEAAVQWLNEHVDQEGVMWWCGGLVIEHRYATIVDAIEEDGLTVQ